MIIDLWKIVCLIWSCLSESLPYETSRLNPEPLCPNLISSYNDGFTSVASGGIDAAFICCSAVIPFDEMVAVFDESGSIRQFMPESLLDSADILAEKKTNPSKIIYEENQQLLALITCTFSIFTSRK